MNAAIWTKLAICAKVLFFTSVTPLAFPPGIAIAVSFFATFAIGAAVRTLETLVAGLVPFFFADITKGIVRYVTGFPALVAKTLAVFGAAYTVRSAVSFALNTVRTNVTFCAHFAVFSSKARVALTNQFAVHQFSAFAMCATLAFSAIVIVYCTYTNIAQNACPSWRTMTHTVGFCTANAAVQTNGARTAIRAKETFRTILTKLAGVVGVALTHSIGFFATNTVVVTVGTRNTIFSVPPFHTVRAKASIGVDGEPVYTNALAGSELSVAAGSSVETSVSVSTGTLSVAFCSKEPGVTSVAVGPCKAAIADTKAVIPTHTTERTIGTNQALERVCVFVVALFTI